MRVDRHDVGLTIGHEAQPPTAVHGIRLSTPQGISVTIWTYGSTLVEILLPDRDGRFDNVVTRLPDLRSYECGTRNPACLGAVMGRYARCISRGSFSLDGVDYQLVRNIGDHHFHGGHLGFDRFVWAAETDVSGDTASLHLRLDRPDGDQGYPGAITAHSTYMLRENGDLVICHRVTTSRSTIVGLCNHIYWNLAGTGSINEHSLMLNARQVVETDVAFIPNGQLASVGGSSLDWSCERSIGQQALDNCYVLADHTWAARMRDPRSGRTMEMLTDQPGLAVYSADMLDPPRSGLCLQATALPDAPNQPAFPSARLDPGDVYEHHTIHRFSIAPKR